MISASGRSPSWSSHSLDRHEQHGHAGVSEQRSGGGRRAAADEPFAQVRPPSLKAGLGDGPEPAGDQRQRLQTGRRIGDEVND
jgi:hypothetical protein